VHLKDKMFFSTYVLLKDKMFLHHLGETEG
jgi:hypothetical protein